MRVIAALLSTMIKRYQNSMSGTLQQHCGNQSVSISLFANKYTYMNIIYVNGRSPEKHGVQLAGI